MRRAALLPLIVLVSCAGDPEITPQSTTAVDSLITYKVDEAWLGFTACRSAGPVAWVRADVLLTDEGPQTLAHELAHAEYAATFESCDAYKKWAKLDPLNRMRSEARAFCASARADVEIGRVVPLANSVKMHAARLANNYPFGLSEAEAEVEVWRFCREEPEP